jgi:hypothetical protein
MFGALACIVNFLFKLKPATFASRGWHGKNDGSLFIQASSASTCGSAGCLMKAA